MGIPYCEEEEHNGVLYWERFKSSLLSLTESRMIHTFSARGQMCYLCFLSALWWQNLPFSMLWLVGSFRSFSFWYREVFEEGFVIFLQWGSKQRESAKVQREGGHHCEAPTMYLYLFLQCYMGNKGPIKGFWKRKTTVGRVSPSAWLGCHSGFHVVLKHT